MSVISAENKYLLNKMNATANKVQLGTLLNNLETIPPGDLTLASAHILVGNGSGVGADVAVSGDLSLANTGAFTIVASAVDNSKVSASAAIAYSKLALTGSILNADVNASAAIAYSKLALTGSIVNADVGASAAIAFSKLAALTSAHILVGNGSNVATDVAMSGDATISNAGVMTVSAATAAFAVGTAFSTARANVASTATIAALSSTSSFVKLTGSTATDLQGIAAGVNGQVLRLWNATGQTLTVRNASASASNGNKITTCTGADITTTGNGFAEFIYDTDASPAVWVASYVST